MNLEQRKPSVICPMAAEILGKTADGRQLERHDLRLVQDAINGGLTPSEVESFANLYEQASLGVYKRCWFHGIEHLLIGEDGYVTWRDICIEHFSFQSKERELHAAIELARRCRSLEDRGLPVTSRSASLFSPLADAPGDTPWQRGMLHFYAAFAGQDGQCQWLILHRPGGAGVAIKEKGYVAVDPTVRHGTRSLQPVVWSDAFFASNRDLWEEARSFGLCFGWAQSSRDVNSTMGMLSVSRSGEPISEIELRDKEVQLAWLTQMAHLGMSRILTAKLMPAATVLLTDREIEVLRWAADGKTASEIADILNISERTANFHIANSIIKLHAPNKTAAVVRAGMLGMLG